VLPKKYASGSEKRYKKEEKYRGLDTITKKNFLMYYIY